MKEILLINPGKRPGSKPKGKKTMAQEKKKTGGKPKKRNVSSSAKKTTAKKRPAKKKRARRRNPSGGFTGRAASLFSLGNLIAAGKQTGGMLACQFFAKRFAGGGGGNDPAWTWKNYAWGLAGTFAAGFGADMIKRGSGKQFVQGGLALLLYKCFINELGPRSSFVEQYFGQDAFDQRGGMVIGTDGNTYSSGDSYIGADGEVYLLGADGLWRPTSESYRDPDMMAGELAPVGPLGFGDELAPVGPLGFGDELAPVGPLGDDPFLEAFTGKQGSGDPYADVFLN